MQIARSSVSRSCRPAHRASVACAAHVERRAALLGLGAALIGAAPARALIPDEEDEELVAKAKANRARRLAEQKLTEREFMAAEGLRDVKVEKELVPVQRAVVQLAKGGSQLDAGDAKGLASTLSGSWVADFKVAAAKVSGPKGPDAVVASLDALKKAASKNDLKASKAEYVALSAALQEWASSAGLSLQGL